MLLVLTRRKEPWMTVDELLMRTGDDAMSSARLRRGRRDPPRHGTIAFRPPLAGGFLCRNFYTMLKHEFYDGFSVKILQVFT